MIVINCIASHLYRINHVGLVFDVIFFKVTLFPFITLLYRFRAEREVAVGQTEARPQKPCTTFLLFFFFFLSLTSFCTNFFSILSFWWICNGNFKLEWTVKQKHGDTWEKDDQEPTDFYPISAFEVHLIPFINCIATNFVSYSSFFAIWIQCTLLVSFFNPPACF